MACIESLQFQEFSRRFYNVNLNPLLLTSDYSSDFRQMNLLVNWYFVYPFFTNELPLYNVVKHFSATVEPTRVCIHNQSMNNFFKFETKRIIRKIANSSICNTNREALKKLNKLFWNFKFPVGILNVLPWHYRFNTTKFKIIREDNELVFALMNNPFAELNMEKKLGYINLFHEKQVVLPPIEKGLYLVNSAQLMCYLALGVNSIHEDRYNTLNMIFSVFLLTKFDVNTTRQRKLPDKYYDEFRSNLTQFMNNRVILNDYQVENLRLDGFKDFFALLNFYDYNETGCTINILAPENVLFLRKDDSYIIFICELALLKFVFEKNITFVVDTLIQLRSNKMYIPNVLFLIPGLLYVLAIHLKQQIDYTEGNILINNLFKLHKNKVSKEEMINAQKEVAFLILKTLFFILSGKKKLQFETINLSPDFLKYGVHNP